MSWGHGTGVPTSGNDLVIVGTDNKNLLHIRIFDMRGNRVTDTDETKLPPAQAQAILTLKQKLPGLLPPRVLTDAEKAQVLREATSIIGNVTFAIVREHLALPALGSFLWDPSSTATMADAELTNYDFLEALRHLAFTRQGKVLRPVDYKNLGAEELGGVYESLLALTPQLSADGARFTFAEFAGSERKTSGSYYTPDSLVQCLLDSALNPVVEEAIRGKTGAEAERAILALKVCDPAVGSGHFLVGAAHRLARHLARVRALAQGESEPSPLLYQHALRDVIGRCLYGVDLNPMAAELCRVGLWLEALEPGKPLSFLDHHIRVGNSLLGATPELVAAGLPDDAFTAIEGDDKKACAVLKKSNKAECRGLGPLFAREDAEAQARLQQAAAALEELPDDRPEDIRAKELAHRRHEQTGEYRQKKRLADAWCAAFAIRKHFREPGRESSASGITQGHLNDLADDRLLSAELDAEVERLSRQYRFFHWHLAFPEVFAQGGFNCVLGNPPWERVKLQEKEWFAQRCPDIAQAPNAAARRRMIQQLTDDDPALYRAFQEDRRAAEGESHIARDSGRFPFCGRGDVNTYTLFTELDRQLIGPRGRVGCIIPTGIASDDTTKLFFQDLIQSQAVVSLHGFENEEFLFPAVHHSTRFCLLTLTGSEKPHSEADFAFFCRRTEQLQEPDRHFNLTADEIRLMNPNTGTCPIFRSRRDAEINKAIYRRVPVLLHEGTPEHNPWGAFYLRLVDYSDHADSLCDNEECRRDGFSLCKNRYIKDELRRLPVYEGKMVNSYDHRFASYVADETVEELRREQHNDPDHFVLPRYWVDETFFTNLITRRDYRSLWFLAYRDVARTSDSRTLISTIIPFGPASRKLPVLGFQSDQHNKACMLANMNSFVVDFTARNKIGSTSMAYYVIKQLPILTSESYTSRCHWSLELNLVAWIVPRTLEPTYTAWDLAPFACDCGYDGPPFRWDEERRFLLRCELDAAFFHLYLPGEVTGDWRRAESETAEDLTRLKASFPTPRDAVAYIMDTFPIVKRKDEEKWGDYRTKRVILEIYDAMAEAIRTGRPYQTLLDPPPGPPTAPLPEWPAGAPQPAHWPPHIHPPRGRRRDVYA
jgi:hypothetical protein